MKHHDHDEDLPCSLFLSSVSLRSVSCPQNQDHDEVYRRIVPVEIKTNISSVDDPYDSTSRILVTMSTLRQLGIFQGDWIQIQSAVKSRYVRVYVTEEETTTTSDAILISSSLAYQLGLRSPTKENQTILVELIKISKKGRPGVPFHIHQKEFLSWASMANIAKIRRPEPHTGLPPSSVHSISETTNAHEQQEQEHSRSNSTIQTMQEIKSLELYFQQARVVTIGDILIVPTVRPNALTSFTGQNENTEHRVVGEFIEEKGEDDQIYILPSQMIKKAAAAPKTKGGIPLSMNDTDLFTECEYYQVIHLQHNATSSTRNISEQASSFLVDTLHTTLSECPSVNSFLPPLEALLPQSKIMNGDHQWGGCHLHVDVPCFHELMEKCSPTPNLPFTISILFESPNHEDAHAVVNHVSACLGFHVLHRTFSQLISAQHQNNEQQVRRALKDMFAEAQYYAPCLICLVGSCDFLMRRDDPESILTLSTILKEELGQLPREDCAFPTHVIYNISSSLEELPSALRDLFLYEIKMELPDENRRRNILQHYFTKSTDPSSSTATPIKDPTFDFQAMAQQTAGRSISEIIALVADTGVQALLRNRAETSPGRHTTQAKEKSYQINVQDFNQACAEQQCMSTISIGQQLKIPSIRWEDIGGLAHVKQEIFDLIQLPMDHPEFFSNAEHSSNCGSIAIQQRSGLLLFGPPGTGKTMVAKAIATEFQLHFLSVKGPELLNQYIGESEHNVRRIFERARNARPCVLFFDELDALAPIRGQGSDSSGVMDRIVSQLLTELDGLGSGSSSEGSAVFVIGATNRPDLLEPALLRPGRFDRLLYLGIAGAHDVESSVNDDRLKILHALTRKFHLASDVNFSQILHDCPKTCTGADFYALSSNALAKSIQDKIQSLEVYIDQVNSEDCYSSRPLLTMNELLNSMSEQEYQPIVHHHHFTQALEELVPSVTETELAHYENLRQQFSITPTTS